MESEWRNEGNIALNRNLEGSQMYLYGNRRIDSGTSDTFLTHSRFEANQGVTRSSLTAHCSPHKSSAMESTGGTEPGSPYPTYYDLDQNRLYTPQRSVTLHNGPDFCGESKLASGHVVTKHERSVTITSNIAAVEEHSWPTDSDSVPHYSNTKVFFAANRLDTANDGYPQSEFGDVQMLPQPAAPDPYSNELMNLSHSWSSGSAMENSSVNSPSITSPKPTMEKKKRGRPYGSKNKPKQVSGAENVVTKVKKVNANGPKKKKKAYEEAAVNTALSIDVHSGEQLSVTSTPNIVNKKKIWGPFVHIEKDIKRDTNIYSIVNIQKKVEDEKDTKKVKPLRDSQLRGNPFRRTSLSKKKVMTLSQQTDTLVRDSSWICVFCKQGSHHKNLGDLFGPYFVSVDVKSGSAGGADDSFDGRDYRSKSQVDFKKKLEPCDASNDKKLKRNSVQESTSPVIDSPETKSNGYCSDQQEVWFHEDCIVWSNGVFLVANRIRNIDDIVKDSVDTVCCGCKLFGATLGCLHKGCSSRFHYLCAKEKGCSMREENFSIHCSKHKKKAKES